MAISGDFRGCNTIYCLTLPCGGGGVRPWTAWHGWQPRPGASHEPRATSREPRFPAVGRRVPSWQFPHPAACPPLAGSSVPFLLHFSPHWHGSCAQRRMAMRPCCKPSNSSQNRSKRRRFPSKKVKKGAHFVMPILTFGGVTPSGASARADLASRKGKKGAFSGAPGRFQKLSTISTAPTARPPLSAVHPRPRGTSARSPVSPQRRANGPPSRPAE